MKIDLSTDNTPLAVGVIVLTVLMLTLGDAAVKGMSADLRLWQIFVLRSALVLPVLVLILKLRFPKLPLWPKAAGWVTLRSLMLALMWVIYYAALPHMDLSVAAAAYYTLPLFITLFSALLLGEPVGTGGWIAVALGFVGVLMILRPAAEAFSPVALLPLGAAVLYALAMILTRSTCRGEHPVVLSFMLNLAFITVGIVASVILWSVPVVTPGSFLSPDWAPINPTALGALVLMSLAVLLGSIGTAIAYQIGRPSTVATFDFSYVGFATLWGVIFFAERPNAWTLAGMITIVVAGLLAMKSSS